jgi:hypothetical protein
MSPPDYDANLVPAPSLTREFEAIPGYYETQVRTAFKARYSKAVEEIGKDIAPTDFRCLFVSTKENFSVRTNQRGSNMQGGLERWLVRSPGLTPKRVQVSNSTTKNQRFCTAESSKPSRATTSKF